MNYKCCGIFGRWFGHKFKEYLIKEEAPSSIQMKEAFTEVTLDIFKDKILDRLKTCTYEVRCQRCGKIA